MKNLLLSIILGTSALAASAHAASAAAKRLPMPKGGIDTPLMDPVDKTSPAKRKTPRQHFEDRARDKACMKDLGEAKRRYQDLTHEIETLKSQRKIVKPEDATLKRQNDEIEEKHQALLAVIEGKEKEDEPNSLLGLMEKCGECQSHPVTTWVSDSSQGKNTWYISDGSCQLPATDGVVLKRAFENITSALTHARSYEKDTPGGFRNILRVLLANVVKGPSGRSSVKFDTTKDAFPPSPLHMAFWLRGPGPSVFQYFLDVAYRTGQHPETQAEVEKENGQRCPLDQTATGKAFCIDFHTVSFGQKVKLDYPVVRHTSASGRAIFRMPVFIPDLVGQWYVNEDGYIRYFTAAILPDKLGDIANLGRTVLLETLFEMTRTGVREK